MGIGTLGEKSLHRELKYLYQPDPARHEVRVGRLIADARTRKGGYWKCRPATSLH